MIYMDNSATSYPKPASVIRAVKRSLTQYGSNPGRGSFKSSVKASEALFGAREALAELVGTLPENIVFTYNATYALNMAILGTVKAGMTVAYDPFAHNSVLRPLYALEERGARICPLKADLLRDSVIISSLESVADKIDVLVLTHTSNVTGKVLPVKRLARICKRHGVKVILDASQAIGSHRIDMRECGIDILASSGHKGLYGIMGSGFLAALEGCDIPDAVIRGGSGILSLDRDMPPFLPERLEAGTVGMPSVISMKAGAEYIKAVTVDEIAGHERELRCRLLEGLSVIKGIRLYNADVNAVSIALFDFNNISGAEAAGLLDSEGIALRSGFHCAPRVHSMLAEGRPEYDGALRLSVGYFNTRRECDRVLTAVNKIAKGHN